MGERKKYRRSTLEQKREAEEEEAEEEEEENDEGTDRPSMMSETNKTISAIPAKIRQLETSTSGESLHLKLTSL